MKKEKIFLAIPCDSSYLYQQDILRKICRISNIRHEIIEKNNSTTILLSQIEKAIKKSDYIIADVSTRSFNIAYELGLAHRLRNYAYGCILIPSSLRKEMHSDIRALKWIEYKSYFDFKKKVINWFITNVKTIKKDKTKKIKLEELAGKDDSPDFYDHFQDFDRFMDLWWLSPVAQINFFGTCVQLTNAHIPILTKRFNLWTNYEMCFKAKILSKRIGWVVRAYFDPFIKFPRYFYMLNYSIQEKEKAIIPHIFSATTPGPDGGYWVLSGKKANVRLKEDRNGWFEIKTQVKENQIKVMNEEKIVLVIDMDKIKKKDLNKNGRRDWNNFEKNILKGIQTNQKDKKILDKGNIGFRCYPDEMVMINWVRCKNLIQ